MKDQQDNQTNEKRKPRSLWRSLHSQPVMISLVLVLLVYLSFILAESFGIEGEGGWLGETIAAALMVGGVIVTAFLVVGGVLFLRHKFGAEKRSAWQGLPDTEANSEAETTPGETEEE